MFIFGSFVQKTDFEQWQSQFCRWILFLWVIFFRVLGEYCFKSLKISLGQCFCQWNIHICYFCTKRQLREIAVLKGGWDTLWFLFTCFPFVTSIIVLCKSCFIDPKLRWTYIFNIEMFIFGSFVQKSNFEQ